MTERGQRRGQAGHDAGRRRSPPAGPSWPTIEKESLDKTGLRSDVVTLYQGGQYHLYRYKKYTDVRLVFAPEQAIAFFGGDTDNFEYPRFNLDICFFRAYEDGKPVEADALLPAGARPGRPRATSSSSPAIPGRPIAWRRWPSCSTAAT